MYMHAACVCGGQRSSSVSSLIIIPLIPPQFKHLFTLCARSKAASCEGQRTVSGFWRQRSGCPAKTFIPKPSHWLSHSLTLKPIELARLASEHELTYLSLSSPTHAPQLVHLRLQMWGTGDCSQVLLLCGLHFTHWATFLATGLTLTIPRLIYLLWSICHFPECI